MELESDMARVVGGFAESSLTMEAYDEVVVYEQLG